MNKLSIGLDSTLGNWKKLCHLAMMYKAEAFIDQKIAESPSGEAEEVVAPESQLLYVLAHIESKE